MHTSYLQSRVARKGLYTGHGATHDQAMTTDAAVPFGADSFQLNIDETSLFKPLLVLLLLREEHPHVCKEPR